MTKGIQTGSWLAKLQEPNGCVCSWLWSLLTVWSWLGQSVWWYRRMEERAPRYYVHVWSRRWQKLFTQNKDNNWTVAIVMIKSFHCVKRSQTLAPINVLSKETLSCQRLTIFSFRLTVTITCPMYVTNNNLYTLCH